jgi:Methyltransferase domain
MTVATTSPWLSIPLHDYEGHMAHPGVGQAALLADLLDQALLRWAPSSIAIIGCAGGNGFERIDPAVTTKVVGVDLNPQYLRMTRERQARRLSNLEVICADVQSEALHYGPVDFTYAALLFEYVDLATTLKTLKRNSRPGAALTTVLQMPHPALPSVSQSPYPSLGGLAAHMHLVPPEDLRSAALAIGFTPGDARAVELSSGKRFYVQNFMA